MNLEQITTDLKARIEHLTEENDHLKSMISVLKENKDLKDRMQGFINDTQDEFTASGTKPSYQWQNTLDERQFSRDLQQTKFKREHRTSSPMDFKSFLQISAHKKTDEAAELQSCQTDIPASATVSDPLRLLGEIAYQLDRRILSYTFQSQKRLYGFTLLNIPEKITEVSTHPLTGKVDDSYQLHLTQRYADLMDRMSLFGYKAALHPRFSEFIVNTYGILKERPSENSIQGVDYNNPEFLRELIVTAAPGKLQKDLLVLLTCLCNMAAKDRKPILLW